MKIFEYGDREKQTIMLLPDALCYWENTFREFIKYAEKHYHIFAVSYDGMENDGTTFESVEKTVGETEEYIQTNLGGKISVIYGSGMGGLIGTLIVSNGKVRVKHLVVSGTSFANPNPFVAKIAAGKKADDAVKVFTEGKMPSQLARMERSFDTEAYAKNVAKIYDVGLVKRAYISRETAYNMFLSQSLTKAPLHIFTDTKIHTFHYQFMGDAVFENMKKHFNEPDMKIFEMEFEDMLFTYPKNLVVIVRRVTGNLKNEKED